MKFKSYQEVFDYVAKFLLEQGEPSVNDAGFCQYRQETGNKKKVLKCAVGCTISKKDYDSVIERQSVDEISSLITGVDFIDDYHDLFYDLQSAHDDAALDVTRQYYMQELKRRLKFCAKQHGLNIKVLKGY